MAKDAQNDGKVSTLSGWDAVVVCPMHINCNHRMSKGSYCCSYCCSNVRKHMPILLFKHTQTHAHTVVQTYANTCPYGSIAFSSKYGW